MQDDLQLGVDAFLRYVWESRFGPMLIEVRDSKAYVNGQAVEPSAQGTTDDPDEG